MGPEIDRFALGVTALGFVGVWLLGHLATRAAVQLLHEQLTDATSADNLRTA